MKLKRVLNNIEGGLAIYDLDINKIWYSPIPAEECDFDMVIEVFNLHKAKVKKIEAMYDRVCVFI